jgi:maltose alpha-D-glucosyltransferase/alpha-amylase
MLTCRRLLPALRSGDFALLDCAHPAVIVYVRCSEAMTVLVAANLSAAGASFRLDLSRWQGQRTREVLWGCEFPPASADWFVYLPAHGFSWWLIGEVDAISEEPGAEPDPADGGEAVIPA